MQIFIVCWNIQKINRTFCKIDPISFRIFAVFFYFNSKFVNLSEHGKNSSVLKIANTPWLQKTTFFENSQQISNMFQFNAHIVRRRKLKKSTLFIGFISAALLGYSGLTFLELGSIPFLEEIARQVGFTAYLPWLYLSLFAILILMILPSIFSIFKKKAVLGGYVSFDEEKLEIVKGRDKYVIPEEDLTQLIFDLKPLPSDNKKKKKETFGGNFMKIPSKRGVFELELHIDSPQQKNQLLEMAEFLKIQHDVKVNIQEIK